MKKYVKPTGIKDRFGDVLTVLEVIFVNIIWFVVWSILQFLVEICLLAIIGVVIAILAIIDAALSPLVFVIWLFSGYTYYPALCKRFYSSIKVISDNILDKWEGKN